MKAAAGVLAASALLVAALPAAASTTPAEAGGSAEPSGPVIVPPAPLEPPGATQTLRLASGSELWTIPYAALQQFVADGTITDRQLLQLAANSGWPDDQLRAALAKPYAVGLVPLANFLYSPAGVAFLQRQTQAFRPLMARGRDAADVALLTSFGMSRLERFDVWCDEVGPEALQPAA